MFSMICGCQNMFYVVLVNEKRGEIKFPGFEKGCKVLYAKQIIITMYGENCIYLGGLVLG